MTICADHPPHPPAIIRRAVTPNPAAVRPVLRIAKAKPRQRSRTTTLCAALPAVPPMIAPLTAAQALALLDAIPAVPPGVQPLVEPLQFDPPGAGPAQAPSTWTLAAAPPPAWVIPNSAPWLVWSPVPGIPEPGTWLLLGAGVALLAWRKNR